MTILKPGEEVKLVIHKARVIAAPGASGAGVLSIACEPGGTETVLTLPGLDPELVTIERLTPENWPVQVADVWGDVAGRCWFAHLRRGQIWLVCEDGIQARPDDLVKHETLTLLQRKAGSTP